MKRSRRGDEAAPEFELIEGSHEAPERRVEIDVEKYQAYIDGLGADHKQQFLAAMWTIITCLVDLGFGVHPAQVAKREPEDDETPSGTRTASPLAVGIPVQIAAE